jgi:hypothetical protein
VFWFLNLKITRILVNFRPFLLGTSTPSSPVSSGCVVQDCVRKGLTIFWKPIPSVWEWPLVRIAHNCSIN